MEPKVKAKMLTFVLPTDIALSSFVMDIFQISRQQKPPKNFVDAEVSF